MALVPADELQRFRESLKRFSTGFTAGQKAMVGIAVVVAIIGAVVFMDLASRPSYGVLYTNLQPSDSGSITSKLAASGIPYKLENGGATILVPQSNIDQERVSLAEAGLPAQSTVGLSSLSKAGITTSQLAQQADYQAALQGQLESTIDAIHGVTSSQVNLAIPTQNTFALNAPTPTGASVLVTLSPGAVLSTGEVQAIVHLVASSVPGLSANNVTVADSTGQLLAGPGVSTAVTGQNSATATYDAAEESSLEQFLSKLVGPGNYDVQVNAALNFNNETKTTHTFVANPKTGAPVTVPLTTTNTNETFSGTASSAGGVLGSTTVPAGATGPVKYAQTNTTTNNDVETQTTNETLAPGALAQQSVAVLVNSKSLPKGTSLASLSSAVRAAAGINKARGDVFSFAAVPFSSAQANAAKQAAAAAAAAKKHSQLIGMIRDAVLIVAILAVIFLLWRSARRAASRRVPPAIQRPLYPLERPEPAALTTTEMPAISRESPEPLHPDIQQFIESQPDEVATLLRSWMDDQRTERRSAS